MIEVAVVSIGSIAFAGGGWLAVDWWTLRRPLRAPTARGRELRLARIEEGKPLRYVCTDCGRKCRQHVYNPSYGSGRPHDMAICDTCITAYPDHDDWSKWMGFDIIRM